MPGLLVLVGREQFAGAEHRPDGQHHQDQTTAERPEQNHHDRRRQVRPERRNRRGHRGIRHPRGQDETEDAQTPA
ncbi:hypothetical protein A605_08680 [Corynebacterium halotolerans YIM 70093 = DSM 44683]|uniref:Uncharacterized protein n=1 Tax=Corynebacterium halotolerans YIM 70093 = DSM 44683 TaxID=1121362 RepID=M1NMY6_9CORY|nr:hypothetical protein A605_08680 [Corynebacterium halotolerans YIM 70093 = DSM 44683]